jgi:glycerol-3-phosphate cytidylyltransferase
VKGRPMVTRILVDMSLTILHHGHIRLLKQASELGYVIVALCTDEEIFKVKGFKPLLSFENRKEIALAIRYVEEVIECDYLIDEAYLDKFDIDFLVHGDDNLNPVPAERLIVLARTQGISSSDLRNVEQR